MEIPSLCSHDNVNFIIEKYSDMVYRLAFSQTRSKNDADDIFQEVFLRYIKKNIKFESEEHIKAWLIRVTVNCSKKLWSSSWIKKTVPLEDNISFNMKEENYIHDILLSIPKKYRSIIHLFYYEDLSVNQISEILKINPSTIRVQLMRARNILKEKLKGEFYV